MYSLSPVQVTNTTQDIYYSSPVLDSRRITENQQSSLPSTPSKSTTKSTPSPDVMAKVYLWLENQVPAWERQKLELVDPKVKPVEPTLAPSSISERKSVHWTPEVEDNEGKTLRQFRPSPSTTGRKRKTSSLHPRKYPKAPEPPCSPPATPRPRRLPTPELPDLKHEGFCNCCFNGPINKMEAQLAAARSHITDSKQRVRRQIERAVMTQNI